MNTPRVLLLLLLAAWVARAQPPELPGSPASSATLAGLNSEAKTAPAATPGPKAAYDAQMEKLTRAPWTWETVMGKNTIEFAKDGTCFHTRFNGTFELQKDDTVIVKMPTREQVLVFNFERGEFTAYDTVLKQRISGRQAEPK
jgi:hypothetical protein